MQATTIHIKTDTKTRDTAKQVAEEFGFTLTSLVNAMLKQIARTKRLSLDLNETPNQYMIDELRKSEEELQAGQGLSFKSVDEAIKYVSQLIEDDDKHKTHHG